MLQKTKYLHIFYQFSSKKLAISLKMPYIRSKHLKYYYHGQGEEI